MIYPYKDKNPNIDPSAFIADYVTITGDVTIGAETSVWFNTVIRGDVAPTVIGNRVSIQDLSCLHQSPNNPLIIEDEVTAKIKIIEEKNDLGTVFIDCVKWDILGAIVENEYKKCGKIPMFFLKLLDIYENGNFPCGWDDSTSNGILIVF